MAKCPHLTLANNIIIIDMDLFHRRSFVRSRAFGFSTGKSIKKQTPHKCMQRLFVGEN